MLEEGDVMIACG